MEAIISSCPNLEHFAYRAFHTSMYYNPDLDGVMGDDVVRLVQGCRRLETLELYNATHVKQGHFVSIANTVAIDLDGYALRKLVAVGYSREQAERFGGAEYLEPFDIRSSLQGHTFLQIEDEFQHPSLGRGIMFRGKYSS